MNRCVLTLCFFFCYSSSIVLVVWGGYAISLGLMIAFIHITEWNGMKCDVVVDVSFRFVYTETQQATHFHFTLSMVTSIKRIASDRHQLEWDNFLWKQSKVKRDSEIINHTKKWKRTEEELGTQQNYNGSAAIKNKSDFTKTNNVLQ